MKLRLGVVRGRRKAELCLGMVRPWYAKSGHSTGGGVVTWAAKSRSVRRYASGYEDVCGVLNREISEPRPGPG
jgi:hypothetical protein